MQIISYSLDSLDYRRSNLVEYSSSAVRAFDSWKLVQILFLNFSMTEMADIRH